jgi:hypothetical protein
MPDAPRDPALVLCALWYAGTQVSIVSDHAFWTGSTSCPPDLAFLGRRFGDLVKEAERRQLFRENAAAPGTAIITVDRAAREAALSEAGISAAEATRLGRLLFEYACRHGPRPQTNPASPWPQGKSTLGV